MAEKTAPPLLSMLQRLPPSKELLDFYHKKLEQYVEDEQRWLKRLASTKKAVDQTATLEKELFAQKREITALQKAVTDMREALIQERKINHKLFAENDKIRVSKMLLLLNIIKTLFPIEFFIELYGFYNLILIEKLIEIGFQFKPHLKKPCDHVLNFQGHQNEG